MDDFMKGLSDEDIKRYKQLYKEYSETDDLNKMKKYIPHLILLREKGELELSKRRKENED